MPRGEKHAGGRPKGSKGKKTLDKEATRQLLREMVTAKMAPMIEAQIANAQGVKYLMARSKKGGQFKRVTEATAKAYADGMLSQEDDIIEVWEKDPNVSAFTDLMNRTIDKPIEQVQADVTGTIIYRWKAEE